MLFNSEIHQLVIIRTLLARGVESLFLSQYGPQLFKGRLCKILWVPWRGLMILGERAFTFLWSAFSSASRIGCRRH
jgi:hypothetical protein